MIEALEIHRATNSIPLPFSQLIDRIPGLTIEAALAALQKAPAKSRRVVACPSDSDSFLVLKEDLETLAQSAWMLKFLVGRGCSERVPVRPLNELTLPLEKTLKKFADNYWPQHSDRLPAGLVPMSVVVGKKKSLFAIHDERFPLPEVELSRKLVAALQSHKTTGGTAYPSDWPGLLVAVGGVDSDDLLRRATLQAPFVDCVREITTKDNILVAMKEDVSAIINSKSILRRLVHEACHAEKPEIKLSALAKALPKDLQESFVHGWFARAKQAEEFDFATLQPAGTVKKRDVVIRDRRYPPEEVAFTENCLRILAGLKALGEASYPTTMQRLVELAGPVPSSVLGKVVKSDAFQSQVICSLSGDDTAPLALKSDESLLANSPRLLVSILEKLRTNDHHLVTLDKVIKYKPLNPRIRIPLESAIEDKITANSLPENIGALKVDKKWALFLMSDVIGAIALSTPSPEQSASSSAPAMEEVPKATDSVNFGRDFDAEFAKLDGKLGLPHYASLVDLRPALKQYPREVFDRELLKLRRTGRYSLSLVEGRYGVSEEERAACLVVDHVPHLLVQKKAHQ